MRASRKPPAPNATEPAPKADAGTPERIKPQTSGFITYKVGLLGKLLDRRSMPWFAARFDLTIAEWRILTFLYAQPSATAKSLAGQCNVDKAEVSRALAALTRRGYASRRPDPRDGRSTLFRITAKGRAQHRRIMPFRQAVQDELVACLTQDELEAVNSALDKLMAHMLATKEPI
jgi:DNA-binding MarR family transcriptional regulator